MSRIGDFVITSKQLENERLFKIIIEQLKLPLLHIARQTEAAKYGTMADYSDINSIAEISIKLIDSYLLTNGQSDQSSLELEPVSLSSILNNAAENLTSLAKIYDCDIELELAGKYAPVMSRGDKLEAAITMLGYSFIESNLANSPDRRRGRLIISGYRTAHGIVAGVFSPEIEVTNETFQRSISNFSSTKQAMPEVSHATGAGIFIADSILKDLATKLRVAHYKRISGLAATLIPSQQLQLV
jgi:hypothetical protein